MAVTVDELIDLIGEKAVILLAEQFAGTRLYVPRRLPADHPIVEAIGADAAARLSERYSPDVIKMPLARELRITHLKAAGLSNAKVALSLGVTETSIETALRRMRKREAA